MKDLKLFIINLSIGIILAGIGLATRSGYYSTLLFAMGFGITFSEALQIIRIMYWKNPKRRKEYEARKEEAHINMIDERKQYLRMKSGYITYHIMTFILLILAFTLALFRIDAWVIGMIFLLFIFQYIIGVISFHICEKNS